MKHYLNWIPRLYIVGLFGYAGISKLNDPSAFASAIAAYRLTPTVFNQVLAVTLPWLECLLAILLLLGLWVRAVALLTCVLSVVFFCAVGSALWRGLEIHCGCFGNQRIGLWILSMELVLLLAGLWLIRDDSARKRD